MSVATAILEYMKGNSRYVPQSDTHERRWQYRSVEGTVIAYISFKYAWDGFRVFILDKTHPNFKPEDFVVPATVEAFKDFVEAVK